MGADIVYGIVTLKIPLITLAQAQNLQSMSVRVKFTVCFIGAVCLLSTVPARRVTGPGLC